MIELPNLWSHQSGQVDEAREVVRTTTHRLNLNGKDETPDHVTIRSVIFQASAGGGKTRCAKWILGNSLNNMPNGKVLFAVHRRNLVFNASESFNDTPVLPHGVVMSNHETDWANRCFVASVDTLNNWWVEGKEYNEKAFVFDVVIIDECHFHLSKHVKYVKAHERRRRDLGLKPAIYIGLSATPANKQMHELFSTIVHGKSTQWLIDNDYLVPFKYYAGKQGKIDVLVKGSGRMGYTEDSVTKAMHGMAGDLVRDWIMHGNNQPTVGFFPTLAQAKQASEELAAAGIATAYIDGRTSDDNRAKVFAQIASGEIKYVCNVGVIEIGTNIPEVSCIQLCTKIGTRGRLEQILGRGSRKAQGKTHCIVIDHLENIAGVNGLGFFEDEWQWTIGQADPTEVGEGGTPIVVCPSCGVEYRGGLCKSCGYEPTPKELEPQGLVFSGTDMKEIIRKPKEQKQPKQQSMEKLMIGAIYAAVNRNMTFAQACHIARSNAKKQGQQFVTPASITVGSKTYQTPRYGSQESKRKVRSLFQFVEHIGKK